MRKINKDQLRNLVFETVKELNQSTRQQELKDIVQKANLVLENADADKIDPSRFPLKLSDAAKHADEAEALVTKGSEDGVQPEDIVNADKIKTPIPVVKLKPSQSSMNIGKAVAFAIAAILKVEPFEGGPGGDLGAIITSDNHIMDGHHRWIASGMIDPTSGVGGYVVEFPAKEMIAALNMITVKLGITQGKPGGGSFKDFNEEGIKPVLEKYAADGVWSAGGDAAKVVEACETFTGESGDAAVAAAAKKMGENVSQLTLSVPDGFPKRPDMPVISKGKGHLDQAIDLLRSGKVDLNEPYFDGDVSETKKARRVILERWNKLAGTK